MEFDGFNEELSLAFEYNGKQHYFFTTMFHSDETDFYQQLEDDDLKKTLSANHGIKLIVIPYAEKIRDVKNIILLECLRYGLIDGDHKAIKEFDAAYTPWE